MKTNKTAGLVFIIGIVAFAGMTAYLLVQGNRKEESALAAKTVAQEIPTGEGGSPTAGGLIETRPILPATEFTGRAARAYQYAAEIPQVVDSLYCYCKCKENPNFKHKTLLTCYTNDHGANCDICMNEVEMAYDMTKQGKSPKEITAEVDKFYAKRNDL